MLHLFNKVYLELDDKIELNYDRVVIGTCGVPLADRVADVTNGQLLSYSTSYPDNFVNLITSIKSFNVVVSLSVIRTLDGDCSVKWPYNCSGIG